MKACCVDAWCGQPLRGPICKSWSGLFEADLLQFMTAMFSRCVLTSTFIEKCFAPLTTFTSVPRARHTFPSVASHHVIAVYEQAVKKWWETFDPAPTSNRARPVIARGGWPGPVADGFFDLRPLARLRCFRFRGGAGGRGLGEFLFLSFPCRLDITPGTATPEGLRDPTGDG